VVAEERAIQVLSNLSAVPDVSGDRDLIFQLIVNLIDNALKYSPEGGRVNLMVQGQAPSVVLTVSDSGCGIPGDQLDKVARRFYRVDKSRRHPGSGLGLSLVQAVADYRGASLSLADNAPGLRVEVAFPVADKVLSQWDQGTPFV